MNLNEYELKRLLESRGFSVPQGILIKKEADYEQIVKELASIKIGPPYVIKITGKGIIHKTELRGVELEVGQDKLEEKIKEFRERFPDYDILIEEMITDKGIEVIAGVIRDEDFGLSIMAGTGGIFTELFQDVTFRLPPVDEIEAYDMINELKSKRLLYGYRGLKPSLDSFVKLIVNLGNFVLEFKDRIQQLDLNPVLLTENDAIVLDAKGIFKGGD